MAGNKALHDAKAKGFDEYYTQYQDISNELVHYRKHFKDKVVYCNCDDPTWSNFWRFFHNNFKSLGLKKLISTHYVYDSQPSYALEYTGGNDFDMDSGAKRPLYGDEEYTAGDFRSKECVELLKEADIVVTNPPFSLFREYVAQLMNFDKCFIIVGPQNAITYKEIFPLLKDNRMWLGFGFRHGDAYFRIPETADNQYAEGVYNKDTGLVHFRNCTWFTNLDISKRHDGLWHFNGQFDKAKAHEYYEGFEHKYPKYDNYDAIEVGKTKDIPIDYPGVMGVPITWLDKYNPQEFEIVGLGNGRENFMPSKDYVNPIMVKNGKQSNGEAINRVLVYCVNDVPAKGTYYLADNCEDMLFVPYARILIRNLHPIAKADDKGY